MNIIAFFAHPDDETMLCGGTLALLAQTGADVHYLCATRGDGGEVGDPPICTPEELGDVREVEMACAVRTLGGKSLTFLDYIDPHIGLNNQLYPYTDDLDGLVDQVVQYIRNMEADYVLTHGVNGDYGHPAHVLSHQAVRLALSKLNETRVIMYSVSASFEGHPKARITNQDEPAHMILDVTPVLKTKVAAALCHRTQHALFVRRSSAEAGRQLSVAEIVVSLESLHRVNSPAESQSDDALVRILEPWLAKI